jgi:Xaa-Pro aminopeptidase
MPTIQRHDDALVADLMQLYGDAREAPAALWGGDVFRRRRLRLAEAIGPQGVAIVAGAAMVGRNADVEHPFRQRSDLFYLTGFDEPEALAFVRGRDAGAAEDADWLLFVRPRDPAAETWTGRRAGVEGAVERFGATAAHDIADLDRHLPELLDGASAVHYTLGVDPGRDRSVLAATQRHWRNTRAGLRGVDHLIDLRATLHEQRLRKAPEEVAALRAAARLSAAAHHEAMRIAAPGRWEYQVQAAIEYVFRAGGSARDGYPSIVAGGDNATILHYNTNRMRLQAERLVLVDAGAEVSYLSADITRTFPASGRFTSAQRRVYEIVLAAEEAAIAVTCAGRPYQDAHEVATRALTAGLVELGVLRGEVDALVAEEAYKPWFMHRTGHWLGMDVHDAGLYCRDGAPRALEPGMVLTVEPGLYFGLDDTRVPAELRGIGVRIEDDVLVTEGGPDVLTADCVKRVDQVEAVCGELPRWLAPSGL